MTITEPTVEELTQRGRQALCRELGVAGAIRFMQLAKPSQGNYTDESCQLFEGQSLDEVLAAIKTRR